MPPKKPGGVQITHTDLMHGVNAARPPSGKEWIYELKYDGFRCLAIKDDRGVKMLSRPGRNMTRSFPEIVQSLQTLPGAFALDGELVVLDSEGMPQFEELARRALTTKPMHAAHAAKQDPAAFFVFDLLYCLGVDQCDRPLLERRQTLTSLLAHSERIRPVAYVDVGEELYAATVQLWQSVRHRYTSPAARETGLKSKRP